MNRTTIATTALVLVVTSFAATGIAGGRKDSESALDAVEVKGRRPPRDEKPYRNLLKAMAVFEENHAMAPQAVMRFKVFPWHDESVMRGLTLALRGKTFRRQVALADDGTFEVERDSAAVMENARVISNRPPQSLAWRPDIRTPGLPSNTRRLGDLRLECKVDLAGTGADLATTVKLLDFWIAAAAGDPCTNGGGWNGFYAWFADQPVFSVTLQSGSRRLTLPSGAMHGWHNPPILNFTDWHGHLRDRTYMPPIWDANWPDDTMVTFDPMNDGTVAGENAKAEVPQAPEKWEFLRFDSGYQIWVYATKASESRILLDSQGVLKKYLQLN